MVDPMMTKLEMMVAYLAGRKGEAADSIRRELEDPTSEASRCLDAVRSRSLMLFGAERAEMPKLIPHRSIPDRTTARGMAGRPQRSLLVAASSAALILIAVGMQWRAQQVRLRQLEATFVRGESRWDDRFNRLEATLTRREAPAKTQPASAIRPNLPEPRPVSPAEIPTILALARIEARLGELGQRLGDGQSRQNQDNQAVALVQRDLDRLRQDAEVSARTSKQESQELSVAVREIRELVRRLSTRSRAMEPVQVPVPILVPPQGHELGIGQSPNMISRPGQLPGQGQMPGQDHSIRAPSPGRGKR
jgi:hypothetical protein